MPPSYIPNGIYEISLGLLFHPGLAVKKQMKYDTISR